MTDEKEVEYALLIRTKISDLGWSWTAETHSLGKSFCGANQNNLNKDRPIQSAANVGQCF